MAENKQLESMRHSLAHIMASAVKKGWPGARFGVGPVVEDGFYYDIDLGDKKLSEEDFSQITKEMQRIIKEDQKFEKLELPIDKAIEWAKTENQPYKLELLNDLKREGTTTASDIDDFELGVESRSESKVDSVSFYKNGDFTDLCRGPHVESTGNVGAFKLIRISGAYWRGKESNPQMQRIYGAAFNTEKELEEYLDNQEKARQYDHRKLGQELDLFLVSPLVGSGLPLFTPRGTILRQELIKYSEEIRRRVGYQSVWVPHIAKQELYEISGHWAKFGEEWLTVKSNESHDNLVMKPMNCPHHQQIYASRPRSYRDLPIRYMETTTVYRDEKPGELLGLARVRSITQDDSHTFCKPDQINSILTEEVKIVQEFYKTLGLDLKVRLSFRDVSDSYIGDAKLWDKAEKIIEEVVKDCGLEYYVAKGEAAFYGPKIDFMSNDSLGRQLQLATPQLDFVQPERFGLKYADEDGSEKTPVLIHFAVMGSVERFLAAYIEHAMGRFPVWLAPEQVRLVTVNQDKAILDFAEGIRIKAETEGLRVGVDGNSESVGKKIRESEVYKTPYTIVIGDLEVKTGKLKPRIRADLQTGKEELTVESEEFLKALKKEVDRRSSKSTM